MTDHMTDRVAVADHLASVRDEWQEFEAEYEDKLKSQTREVHLDQDVKLAAEWYEEMPCRFADESDVKGAVGGAEPSLTYSTQGEKLLFRTMKVAYLFLQEISIIYSLIYFVNLI